MDNSLIWLLIPGTLAIFYYVWVSVQYRYLSYDLVEYLLAGKRVSSTRFILASTTVTLLGVMSLPHMGLFYRSGFSYGFAALAVIIVPLTAALFAKRIWILGRIFNPLTSTQLLGDYYRSNGIRLVTALTAILIALTLTIMSLRFGASLTAALPGTSSLISLMTMTLMSALLFFHAAFGGMGAIMRVAAPAGIALILALIVATLVCIDALGGFASLIDELGNLQKDQINAPLFAPGALYDPLPAAAPTNISWPGTMILTSLLALMGLASTPATIMINFTAAKGRAHAPQQFFAAALMSGLVLFTTTIIIALAARMAHKIPDLGATNPVGPLSAGSEPHAIMSLLLATPLGNPLVLGFITFVLLAGLVASTSAALLTAGATIANDIFYEKLKCSHLPTFRKSITRFSIGLLLGVALLIAWQKPDDPLPLFLLAGAFGLQLLPALVGLCYFPSLGGKAVRDGVLAGLAGVVATSMIPQGLTEIFGINLPFDAWPLSLHPAFWGLAANCGVLLLNGLFGLLTQKAAQHKQSLAHQLSYHVLPDGKPLMAPYARIWWLVALLAAGLFVLTIAVPLGALPLSGFVLHDIFPSVMPPLWIWQILSWIIGLALVYIAAYKLQPIFDPEQALDGSLDPLRRRFRVKAQSRKHV
ncbi:MAG: hypothetical protein GY927_09990 [bacterium]|nr:hypothetical protein [bacterium]